MRARGIFAGIPLILILFCASSFGKYSGGTGEPNDPYRIATPEDLNSIGLDPCDWDKHFLMTADINMAEIPGTSFNMIGSDWPSIPFTGVFDGNSHTISNLAITGKEGEIAALFRYVKDSNALIAHLILVDPNISSDGPVGGLVNYIELGRIIDCHIIGGII